MSKAKHRTPENLLIRLSGGGQRFWISKKVRVQAPSTVVQGYTTGHCVQPVQRTDRLRVYDLPNPGRDLTLKLKRVAYCDSLRWEYGFRIEAPELQCVFHVYSNESMWLLKWTAEHSSGSILRTRFDRFDRSVFRNSGDIVSLVKRNLSQPIRDFGQIISIR